MLINALKQVVQKFFKNKHEIKIKVLTLYFECNLIKILKGQNESISAN